MTGCGIFGDQTLGRLVTFAALSESDHQNEAAELTAGQQPQDALTGLRAEDIPSVSALTDEMRRFAFIDTGCRHDSAQLRLTDGALDAQLLENGSTEQQTMCAQAVYFLSVFDVPVADLPDEVRLR